MSASLKWWLSVLASVQRSGGGIQKRRSFFTAPERVFLLFLLSAFISSCASTGPSISRAELKKKEEEFNLKFLQASQKWSPRVYRIGYQLLKSPVPELNANEPKYNFVGVGVEDLKEFARKAYGINKTVSGVLVMGTYPGSEAVSADLHLGDVIEKVNGRRTKSVGDYFKAIRQAKGKTAVMEIWRSGQRHKVDVPVEKVYYNAQFFLEPTPQVNAFASFSKISVGIGAIRYCRNDDELAVVMGHELAHTTLKHMSKKIGAGLASAAGYGAVAGVIDAFTVPGVGGLLISPMQQATDAAVSRRYEREADYNGMRHTFHSGYDVENGSKVFARMATDEPSFAVLSQTFASHPVNTERFLRFEKTVEEFKTQFPDKFPMTKSEDWEIIVPVGAGENKYDVLERLLAERKIETLAAPAEPAEGLQPKSDSEVEPKTQEIRAEVVTQTADTAAAPSAETGEVKADENSSEAQSAGVDETLNMQDLIEMNSPAEESSAAPAVEATTANSAAQ